MSIEKDNATGNYVDPRLETIKPEKLALHRQRLEEVTEIETSEGDYLFGMEKERGVYKIEGILNQEKFEMGANYSTDRRSFYLDGQLFASGDAESRVNRMLIEEVFENELITSPENWPSRKYAQETFKRLARIFDSLYFNGNVLYLDKKPSTDSEKT